MENASKALLIAGSVLIAIILIALGVRIINTTSKPANQIESTMNTTEMATFNSKFTQYVGKNKTKANIISMLNAVIANNATNTHKVNVNGNSNPANLINNVEEGIYTIRIDSNDYTNGFITNIEYTKN